MPPKSTPYPEKAIVNIYNPAQHNVKVRSLRTALTKELIARTDTPDDINKRAKAATLAKHGYKVIPFKPRNLKILIFGLTISDKQFLVESIYDQNVDLAVDYYKIFETQFRPSHSWIRSKKTHNWVVEVVSIIRKRIMNNGSRLYN